MTLFTIPKSFIGINKTHQINAIKSWIQLNGTKEIILFISDKQTYDDCKLIFENHVMLVRITDFNEYGTPLLNKIYKTTQEISKFKRLCFINSDIILFNNFLENIGKIYLTKSLIAGRRIDLDLNQPIDFDNEWQSDLRSKIKKYGKLHSETGCDFYIFDSNDTPDMPNFAIGRGWWDNWIIYDFKKRNIPVIDATSITSIHQNHDYSHIKSVDKKTTKKGLEREQNGVLSKLNIWNILYITDSEYVYDSGNLQRRKIIQILNRLITRYIKIPIGSLLQNYTN